MATTIIGIPASSVKFNFSAAAGMNPSQRLDLALQGLAGPEQLSDLARNNGSPQNLRRIVVATP
jgi:hypothetical protein